MADGTPLAKSVYADLPEQTLRYLKRAEALLAKVKPEDWDKRTPHALHEIRLLVMAKTMAALASPQPYPPLYQQNRQRLAKETGDDFSDDEDGGGDDNSDSGDGADSSNGSRDGGDADFNSKHPRWPAGSPDSTGGEFMPKDGNADNDTPTPPAYHSAEYQVAQRTDVATDAVPANNQATVTVHSRTNITINNPDGSSVTRTGGSASWRNNNASNIISGNFADNHGAVGDNHGFAVFPDQATGDAASAALLRTSTYSGMTIDEAIAHRSPPEENDTKQVQENVKQIGDFTGNEIVGQLNQEQMSRLVNAIKQAEGYHAGTVTQTPARGN